MTKQNSACLHLQFRSAVALESWLNEDFRRAHRRNGVWENKVTIMIIKMIHYLWSHFQFPETFHIPGLTCSPVTWSGLEGGYDNIPVMREMPAHLCSRVGWPHSGGGHHPFLVLQGRRCRQTGAHSGRAGGFRGRTFLRQISGNELCISTELRLVGTSSSSSGTATWGPAFSKDESLLWLTERGPSEET